MEKVWQPGNLVARKVLKNQALAESFLDPSPVLSHKQTIRWKRQINDISTFRLLCEGTFMFKKYAILRT